jgi:predicted DNA-binding transcriptional regulator YafY
MTAVKPIKRNRTAKEVAARLGVSERTVRRYIAQPREEFLAEGHARQDKALELRESGLKWREVAEALGGMSASGALQLAAKAKKRREELASA